MNRRDDGGLRISEVRIRMADSAENGLIAWASCVIDRQIYLNNIAIRRQRDGSLVLTYPAKRSRRDVKHFYFRPITPGAKEILDRAILGRLQEMTQTP